MNINMNHTSNLDLRICGGKEFDRTAIDSVETPQGDDRWNPISHGYLIDRFAEQAEENGLSIQGQHLTLAREGQRFFGLFHVTGSGRENTDNATIIGLRNAHDKSFAAGICAGDAPFICTNLIFSNEIKLGRKHTTNIIRDLPQVISRAIGKLSSHWNTQDKRAEVYRNNALTDAAAHDLIIRAFRNGAIPKAKIADVANQWHNPEHDVFSDRNGHSLYQSFTNVLRGNINALNQRSDALHATLDAAFGMIKKEEVIEV